MCEPKSEGGRRCAAHTRPDFQTAIARVTSAKTAQQLDTALFNGYLDIARHASTPTGERETKALRAEALNQGDDDMASYLDACLTVAEGMRYTHARIAEELRARTGSHDAAARR
jgi:hypothetical protein